MKGHFFSFLILFEQEKPPLGQKTSGKWQFLTPHSSFLIKNSYLCTRFAQITQLLWSEGVIRSEKKWEPNVMLVSECRLLTPEPSDNSFNSTEIKLKRSSCWPELAKVNLKTELYGTGGEYLWGLTMVLTMVLHRQYLRNEAGQVTINLPLMTKSVGKPFESDLWTTETVTYGHYEGCPPGTTFWRTMMWSAICGQSVRW